MNVSRGDIGRSDRRTLLRGAAGCASGSVLGSAAGAVTVTGPGARAAGAGPRPADWSALGRSLSCGPGSGLVRPGDADYATARRLHNTRFDGLRPAAIAYVATTTDITECLAFARRHTVPVSIRNGGHSYAGWSSGDGRLVIDVSRLNRITCTRTTATIGAGAKLVDVYDRLGAHGIIVPAGTCPTVGISGLTLGGGHGVTSRAYGLTCDSLLSATLVTADGRTLRCDASRHRDLFWALRGAGNGNFGVVTELRFRTQAPRGTVSARLIWPWSRAAAVLGAWQEWGPAQPDEIWSSVHLTAAAGGTPRVRVSVFSLGTYGDLHNALDRLTGRVGAPPSTLSLHRRTYQEAMRGYARCASYSTEECHLPGSTPGRNPAGVVQRETYAAGSDFYDRELTAQGIQVLVGACERYSRDGGSGSGQIHLTALGGAINRVPSGATAFVHRRSRVLAQYRAAWPAGRTDTVPIAWLDALRLVMRHHASGAAYQNYPDPRLRGWRRAYYGPAAERLARVKRRYDPDRLFDFPQAL